jgi:hypothetical protein
VKASNTQNYNRYGYCLNNPLKYTDPSGEIFGIDDIIISAVIIGAIISAGTYALNALRTGTFSLSGFVRATFIGAISGALTAGIAQGFGAICNFSSTAIGFLNGAAVGASTGFVTGITSSAFNSLVSGGSIKLSQLLKDGLIGAAMGGAIGGISGGYSASKQGKGFWSGKKWYSVGGNDTTFTRLKEGILNFDDFKQDTTTKTVELDIKTPTVKQTTDMDCTHACKKWSDNHFKVSDQDNINTEWFNKVKDDGFKFEKINGEFNFSTLSDEYTKSGYRTEIYNGKFTSKEAGTWVRDQLLQQKPVNISYNRHNSVIIKMEYREDFKSVVLRLMQPGSSRPAHLMGFGNTDYLFSIWK